MVLLQFRTKKFEMKFITRRQPLRSTQSKKSLPGFQWNVEGLNVALDGLQQLRTPPQLQKNTIKYNKERYFNLIGGYSSNDVRILPTYILYITKYINIFNIIFAILP